MKISKQLFWVACLALVPAVLAMAQATETLQVNVGESVIVKVDKPAKLAIADDAVAVVTSLSDKEISVIGKRVGITTLTVVPEADSNKPTLVYRVEVGNDTVIGAIRKAISTGAVNVRVIGDTLVLEGQVENELEAQRAEAVAKAFKPQVANLIEIKNPRQIKIRMRVAEVSVTEVRRIGLKWLGEGGQVGYAFGFGGTDNLIDPIKHGFLQQATDGSLGTEAGSGVVGADVVLQLLEQKGWARLLSEPTLVTRSGTEASFLVGSEVPIVQTLNNTSSVEFKEVGVRMKVKPVADSQNRINTTIHAEVSQVSSEIVRGGDGGELPIILTRKADTTLQLKDGQTLIIGGLMDNNIDRDTLRKFPWLADIPVIGALFRHKDRSQSQRELLFFLTPSVIKDAEAEVAAAPKTPLFKDWSQKASENVLDLPDKKDDWGLHNPENLWGIPEQQKTPDNGVDGTKEPVKNYTPARPAAK